MISVGLDVGGSFVKAVVMDEDGKVGRARFAAPTGGLVGFLASAVDEVTAARRPHRVGVGMAGLVEWPAGYFVGGPHVPERGLAVADELEALVGCEVVVDNDANLAAYAELTSGAAQGVDSALVLTLGTGIGAGLIMDGQVVRGSSFAGEVGHTSLVPGGGECECGRMGCWETLASGVILDRRAEDLAEEIARIVQTRETVTGSDLVRAAQSGHRASIDALADVGRNLGLGIVQLSLILDPEVVAIAGGPSEAGVLLTGPASEAIASTGALEGRGSRPQVVAAHHRGWAGAVGAAGLARDWKRNDR